jgi:prepilin-type N-terminal cleavage/methylation domain-containing protein
MQRLPRSPYRAALTLIELLVVIFLISIIAGLTAWYVAPSFQDNKNVVRGLDRVAQFLLIAKQRALRDQAPRGLRFVVNNGLATQVQLVELPDNYSVGSVLTAAGNAVTLQGAGVDLIGPGNPADVTLNTGWVIQPGDYFRCQNSNYPILNGLTLNSFVLRDPIPGTTTIPAASQYQIIRQTRPISGEAPIDLPTNVVVDLATVSSVSPTNQVPSGVYPTPNIPGNPVYEIVFDIGGGVMNRGGSAPICLIVRDATADNPLDPNTTRVLAIYPRTGMVATHPVSPTGNPVQFALNGTSSGM